MAVSYEQRPPRRGFPVLWPVILIVVGIILLLNSLEIVPWSIWGYLARFWPVILILIGVEILMSRLGLNWIASLLVAIVLIVVIVGLAITAVQAGWLPPDVLPPGTTQSTQPQSGSVDQALDILQEARVNIDFGAGQLTLDSLPASSDRLAAVDYAVGAIGLVPRLTMSTVRNQSELRISGTGNVRIGRSAGPDEWNVHLSPSIPIDLVTRVGAAEANLDLTDLKIRTLDLNVGASNAVVRFPAAAGSTRATINAGAASLAIEIPPESGASINQSSGLASIDMSSRFTREGNVYSTENYQTAANRIYIDLKAGVSRITIK